MSPLIAPVIQHRTEVALCNSLACMCVTVPVIALLDRIVLTHQIVPGLRKVRKTYTHTKMFSLCVWVEVWFISSFLNLYAIILL